MSKKVDLSNPANLLELSNDQLEQVYWQTKEREDEIALMAEELKAQRDAIKTEFIERIKKAKRDGFIVGNTSIKMFTKIYTNNVELETARELGAVKTEEKVDGPKIANIVRAGGKVAGAEERTELKFTKIEEEQE